MFTFPVSQTVGYCIVHPSDRSNIALSDPITHTLSIERIREKTADVAKNAEEHLQIVGEFKAELLNR